MDYKSRFKSHQQFKTNTIYNIILQLNRKLDIFPLIKKLGLKILSQAREDQEESLMGK